MTTAPFTVIHGDAMDLLRTLPANSVDAVITDPPYSSGGAFRADRVKATGDKYVIGQGQEKRADFHGDNRDQRSFLVWCSLWMAQAWRVTRDGGILITFCDWRQLPTMTDAVQCGGWTWRGIVPWNKTEATRPQKGWFRSQCEYIIVAAKGIPAGVDVTGKSDAPCLAGFAVCPVDRTTAVHQTQKPVDLMRWLMQVTPKSGTILDPFAGSGTTGVAALMEGRQFIGFELTEHYADHARRRCAAAVQGGAQSTIQALPA